MLGCSALCLPQQLRLLLKDSFARQHRNLRGRVAAVLDDGDSGHDRHLVQDDLRGQWDRAGGVVRVECRRAAFLAQADRHDFAETALVVGAERSVGLDTIDGNDGVGLGRVPVPEDRHIARFADLFHFQAAVNGDAQFGHAIADENCALAFGGAAAVAAHRRNEKRFGPQRLQRLDDRPHNLRVAGDPAAAHGHGHPHPGPHTV